MPGKSKILVVDDDQAQRDECRRLLARAGYLVQEAADGREALQQIKKDPPDLLIVDMVMPELDGLSLCRLVKGQTELGFMPIIILTVRNDTDSRVQALKLGADDYISKPANGGELLARVEALLRIKDLQDRMSNSLRQADDTALVDTATGLYNERYLHKRLADEFKRAERHAEPISLLMVETDHPLLTASRCAEQLRNSVRDYDIVCRLAGERFAVVLPRTHFTGALSVASRVWQNLAGQLQSTSPRSVPVNIGASFYPNREVDSSEVLIQQAWQALAKARDSAEGRICLFQQTTYYYRPDMGR